MQLRMDCTVRRPCVEADFDWAQLAGAACISRPLDEIPQGLKPRLLSAPSGTTEAGPCKSRLLQPVLELFEVGEFLHQLLHAVPRKEHGELGFIAVAFAHHDLPFTIFAVADALSFSQAGGNG